jgi:C4-dicarboxylate-specific signal transduction histidine kinase
MPQYRGMPGPKNGNGGGYFWDSIGNVIEENTSLKKKVEILKNRQHLGGRGRWISEFEARLAYKVSSRTARAIQRNPVSKNKTKQRKQTNKQTNKTRKKESKQASRLSNSGGASQ